MAGVGAEVEAFVFFAESDISREDTLVSEDRDTDITRLSGDRRITNVITLALDSSTPGGSVALVSRGQVLGCVPGDATEAHSERLPNDVLTLLATHKIALREVNLFAVCVGPGSFTGLRVGLATIKGMALASRRRIVPISTLEALAHAGLNSTHPQSVPELIVPWMNAQRGEVFASVYAVDEQRGIVELEQPRVGTPEAILDGWSHRLTQTPVIFVGDGLENRDSIINAHVKANVLFGQNLPPLAPIIGILAENLGVQKAIPPHSVIPFYLRRPYAELAPERRRAE